MDKGGRDKVADVIFKQAVLVLGGNGNNPPHGVLHTLRASKRGCNVVQRYRLMSSRSDTGSEHSFAMSSSLLTEMLWRLHSSGFLSSLLFPFRPLSATDLEPGHRKELSAYS